MSEKNASPGCAVMILGAFIAMALGVTRLIEANLSHSIHHEVIQQAKELKAPSAEGGMYHAPALPEASDQRRAGAKVRRLKEFYERRAYPGAPPVIPHPVIKDDVIAHNCLACHEKGGYVPDYQAYAPLSPHPEKENCRQCHVPQSGAKSFVESDWIKPKPPQRGQSALGGSPPKIPHTLQLRENCLSCHGGMAAVEEIRVSHPERENCRQCHVPQTTNLNFQTPFGVE